MDCHHLWQALILGPRARLFHHRLGFERLVEELVVYFVVVVFGTCKSVGYIPAPEDIYETGGGIPLLSFMLLPDTWGDTETTFPCLSLFSACTCCCFFAVQRGSKRYMGTWPCSPWVWDTLGGLLFFFGVARPSGLAKPQSGTKGRELSARESKAKSTGLGFWFCLALVSSFFLVVQKKSAKCCSYACSGVFKGFRGFWRALEVCKGLAQVVQGWQAD